MAQNLTTSLIPLDEGTMFAPSKRGRSIAKAFGDLIAPKTEVILKNFEELQKRNPDRRYELIKEGGENISTLAGSQPVPVRYFAREVTTANMMPSPQDLPSQVGRPSFPAQVNAPVAFAPSINSILAAVANAGRPPFVSAEAVTTQPQPAPPQPTQPELAPTQAFMDKVAQSVAARPLDAVRRNIREPVDEAAALAERAAKWERYKPVPPPARAMPTRAPVPEIFQAVNRASEAASQITGYNPRNPPQVHTLSKQQYLSLNPIMRSQYEQATMRRKQQIDEAKSRYDSMMQLAMQSERDKQYVGARESRDETRQSENDTLVAAAEVDVAESEKRLAERRLKLAEQADKDWRRSVDAAKAQGAVIENGGVVALTKDGDSRPAMAAFAMSKNAERAKINEELRAAKDQEAVAVENFELATRSAKRVKGWTARNAPAAAAPATAPKSFGQWPEGERIFDKDGKPYVVKNGRPVPIQ